MVNKDLYIIGDGGVLIRAGWYMRQKPVGVGGK